jgi:transcriptional regulator of acetoin/glycerol metabolism
MSEEREKVRCGSCELVQWRLGANCRRCAAVIPQPIVKIVERVIEKVVVRQDPECLKNLEQARQLIAAASDRLMLQPTEVEAPIVLAPASKSTAFPTMAEMERAMILAAYRRSNRKPLEAARLLGIGKTSLYRKLRKIDRAA